MKNNGLCLLAVLALTHSCGPNNKGNQGSTDFKIRMHLSAFADLNNQSTLDLSRLDGIPRVVNLKNAMTDAKNQGERGTCTFFTTMALVEAAIKKDQSLETNLSEEYLNYETKNAGFFSKTEGSVTQNNLFVLKKTGILLEKDWSYQPSWFVKGLPCSKYKSDDATAPERCFSHNSPTAVAMGKRIPSTDFEVIKVPADTNEIIKFFAREKRPLSFAMMIHEKGFPSSGDIYYDEALRAECLKKPDSCGGHAMTLTGYDLDKKIFFVKNSHGKEWGREGYGTVTFDTIDRFSSGEYYSVRLKGKLPIAKNEVADNLKLKSFNVRSALENNNALSIKATGELQGTEGRFIYVSSFLVKKKDKSAEGPNDNNTETINLSPDSQLKINDSVARSMAYYNPGFHTDRLHWGESSPINLDIGSDILNTPEVANAMKSGTYLRTTIYSFTDGGYKVLKRIYHQLTQK